MIYELYVVCVRKGNMELQKRRNSKERGKWKRENKKKKKEKSRRDKKKVEKQKEKEMGYFQQKTKNLNHRIINNVE